MFSFLFFFLLLLVAIRFRIRHFLKLCNIKERNNEMSLHSTLHIVDHSCNRSVTIAIPFFSIIEMKIEHQLPIR